MEDYFYIPRCYYGDKVDSYHPFPKTYSDYKVYNLLKDCTTDSECWAVIHNEYKFHYHDITEWTTWDGRRVQGDYLTILQVYLDVVHMRRWDNDRIDVKQVLTKMGIDY